MKKQPMKVTRRRFLASVAVAPLVSAVKIPDLGGGKLSDLQQRSPKPEVPVSDLPFHSFERISMGLRGVVCTSNPLASDAAMWALKDGGNAFDAALAAAAVLTVVEPQSSHLGGDVFLVAYVAKENKVYALNGSGRAPREIDISVFAGGIPERGPLAATIPGAVHGWCEVSRRWGKLPLKRVLQPAIEYARDGFPISVRLARSISTLASIISMSPYARQQFLSIDPKPGNILRQPALARTLEAIADQGVDGFYQGEIAKEMVRGIREQGGVFSEDDLREHDTIVVAPISTSYRGVKVLEQPPVSQGHILLEELNIVENFDLKSMGLLSADTLHVLIEAKKLAFADKARYLGDPEFSKIPVEELVSKEWGRRRAEEINLSRANPQPEFGHLGRSNTDTTYLAVADSEGNAVSWIQSIFFVFGSGVVAGNTGVLLNNRMNGFTIQSGHPNTLEPGKRPVHTLNAYILMKDDKPWIVGGTPGGDYQVQTNLQVISNLVDFDLNIAEANDAPWWASLEGNNIRVENRVRQDILAELEKKGHRIDVIGAWAGDRIVQLVQFGSNGALLGASDLRGEGYAAAW